MAKHIIDKDNTLKALGSINTLLSQSLQVIKKVNEDEQWDFCTDDVLARIVLSSTWRNLDNPSNKVCYQMYEYLLKSLAKYDMKIMSKTPTIHMNRPLEIITWVNNQIDKEDIKFVSLDDDFSVEDYAQYGIEDRLIHTKFFCNDISEGGLQQEHVDRAMKILMN